MIPSGSIVAQAASGRVAACAFNVIQIELAEAIVTGAERAGAPVILQISENAAKYHGALAPITRACQEIAKASSVPVCVHLDHAESPALVAEALDLGVDSIMFDGSKLDDDSNRAVTAAVTAMCHARGALVEAEFGQIGGKDGVHAPGARTNPEQAAEFVAATGVDCLAVAVGSSHAMTERTAVLDLDLISQIHRLVPVPLVLHGSSGVPDAELVAAVAAGMTKINIATLLSKTFTDEVRHFLDQQPQVADTRKYFASARQKVAQAVEDIMRLLTV